MTEIEIWVDGACSGNPGNGGWAVLVERGNGEKGTVLAGKMANTTNNRMELMAAISGIEMLNPHEKAILYSDSQYVVNGITKWISKWKRNNWKTADGPVKNQDLWEKLDRLAKDHSIRFQWVRGHSVPNMNLVDSLAKDQTKRSL